MRYPITKLVEGHGLWWYVNPVFNEDPKERNRMMLGPANGVAKGEIGCLLLQHVRSSAVEEHDWEALVHSCENGGGHRPVVKCNGHNWCSVGVTTVPFFCVYPVFLQTYILLVYIIWQQIKNRFLFCTTCYSHMFCTSWGRIQVQKEKCCLFCTWLQYVCSGI